MNQRKQFTDLTIDIENGDIRSEPFECPFGNRSHPVISQAENSQPRHIVERRALNRADTIVVHLKRQSQSGYKMQIICKAYTEVLYLIESTRE